MTHSMALARSRPFGMPIVPSSPASTGLHACGCKITPFSTGSTPNCFATLKPSCSITPLSSCGARLETLHLHRRRRICRLRVVRPPSLRSPSRPTRRARSDSWPLSTPSPRITSITLDSIAATIATYATWHVPCTSAWRATMTRIERPVSWRACLGRRRPCPIPCLPRPCSLRPSATRTANTVLTPSISTAAKTVFGNACEFTAAGKRAASLVR